MSDNTDKERTYIAALYSGPGWKKRVSKMSDAQVLAIYKKEKSKPPKPKRKKPDAEPF